MYQSDDGQTVSVTNVYKKQLRPFAFHSAKYCTDDHSLVTAVVDGTHTVGCRVFASSNDLYVHCEIQ